MTTLNNCLNCRYYSEEFYSDENHYENHCTHYEDYCFIPRTNCNAFTLNTKRIPLMRSPNFDTKRSLIHQIAISNPDITIQQMADAVSHLTSKEPCNLDCLNCNEFYRSTYCFPEA